MTTVRSTTMTHILSPGCHPAIREALTLPAGVPVEVPRAALAFVLSLPGVEDRTTLSNALSTPNPSPEPPAPEASQPQE